MTSALPPIIDVAHLQTLLAGAVAGDRPLQLLDVRWALDGSKGHHTYLEGHLPGHEGQLDRSVPHRRRLR